MKPPKFSTLKSKQNDKQTAHLDTESANVKTNSDLIAFAQFERGYNKLVAGNAATGTGTVTGGGSGA